MAQKVNITLVDDLDGSPADETVSFGLDGTNYEIDLNDKNAAALRSALAPYLAEGRRVARTQGGARRGTARRASSSGVNLREVRDWARSNGHDVSDRGRVSAEVLDAFHAAH